MGKIKFLFQFPSSEMKALNHHQQSFYFYFDFLSLICFGFYVQRAKQEDRTEVDDEDPSPLFVGIIWGSRVKSVRLWIKGWDVIKLLILYHSGRDTVADLLNLFAKAAKECITELSFDDHNGVNMYVVEIY